MGALSQLLYRANPANSANPAGQLLADSQDSQATARHIATLGSHDSQDSHVQALRESLRQAATEKGLPVTLAEELDTADVRACEGLSHDVLRAYLRAVARSRQMATGNVPKAWTRAADCAGCGHVLLWPGLPESVPGCPWCHHRRARQTIQQAGGD